MLKWFLVLPFIVYHSSAFGIVGDVIDWASDRADKTLLSKCFDGYGCFSIGGKFVSVHRPINLFPFSPNDINIKFLLLTRSNPLKPMEIIPTEESLMNSTFRVGFPVKIIIHGFIEEGKMKWIKRMALQLLRRGDFNVISVDWNTGATPPYTQAVANSRIVGAVVAEFIDFLKETYAMHPEYMHIIGHSLGAHAAGYAGERLNKLGRITGLDPAQPYFENTHPIVRLDPSDAIFVDVVHTDTTPILQGGFGFGPPCGHVDFYPNGGQKQPGCRDNFIDSIGQENGDIYGGVRHYIGCSHIRAHEYFTESINPTCPFLSVQCASAEEFAEGSCFDCGFRGDRCAPFGYHSIMWRNFSAPYRQATKMYLLTGSEKPYCRYHQRIIVTLTDNIDRSEQVGKLIISLIGVNGLSQRFVLNEKELAYQPATTYIFVIATSDAGPYQKLDLEWKPSSNVMRQLTWRVLGNGKSEVQISHLEVEGLETGYRTYYCVEDVVNQDIVYSVLANRPCPTENDATPNIIDDNKSAFAFNSVSSRSATRSKNNSNTNIFNTAATTLFTTFLEKMLDIVSPQQ